MMLYADTHSHVSRLSAGMTFMGHTTLTIGTGIFPGQIRNRTVKSAHLSPAGLLK